MAERLSVKVVKTDSPVTASFSTRCLVLLTLAWLPAGVLAQFAVLTYLPFSATPSRSSMTAPFRMMRLGWRRLRAAIGVVAFASLSQLDDKCAELNYTLSPEGPTALHFDVNLRDSVTATSHPSATSSQLLLSIPTKGLSNQALTVDIEETSADGVKKVSIPDLAHILQEDIKSEGRGSSMVYNSLIVLPFFVAGLYYLHKRGGGGAGLAIGAGLLGAGVLAVWRVSTSVTVSVPDTYCMRILPSAGAILLKECSSSFLALTGGFPVMDTHTHAWENCSYFSEADQDLTACPPTPGEKTRYTPAGVLPFWQLEEKWYSQNITYGVLVQPSFMGVNNSYILKRLAEYPRLRGVVVVTNSDGTLNPAAAERTLLEEYHRAGVRGIRLNLLKQSHEDMARLNAAMNAENGEKGFRDLWAFIKEHGWHVEAQQESEGWVNLIETLVGEMVFPRL